MARKYLIAGNWKMNMNQAEAKTLAVGLKQAVKKGENVDVLVCPTFTSLAAVKSELSGSDIMVGAQNLSWAKSGAFTGEISADMLLELGCSHVIIGHSERRQYFGETNASVNSRTKAALAAGLIPVVCIGETLEERQGGKMDEVILSQTKEGLADISNEDAQKLVIAYEPVWAIGTGVTASPEQAQEVHASVRAILTEMFGVDIVQNIQILYGGSMKPDNAAELLAQPDIDGGLIGGASLKATDFAAIVDAAK